MLKLIKETSRFHFENMNEFKENETFLYIGQHTFSL